MEREGGGSQESRHKKGGVRVRWERGKEEKVHFYLCSRGTGVMSRGYFSWTLDRLSSRLEVPSSFCFLRITVVAMTVFLGTGGGRIYDFRYLLSDSSTGTSFFRDTESRNSISNFETGTYGEGDTSACKGEGPSLVSSGSGDRISYLVRTREDEGSYLRREEC